MDPPNDPHARRAYLHETYGVPYDNFLYALRYALSADADAVASEEYAPEVRTLFSGFDQATRQAEIKALLYPVCAFRLPSPVPPPTQHLITQVAARIWRPWQASQRVHLHATYGTFYTDLMQILYHADLAAPP